MNNIVTNSMFVMCTVHRVDKIWNNDRERKIRKKSNTMEEHGYFDECVVAEEATPTITNTNGS